MPAPEKPDDAASGPAASALDRANEHLQVALEAGRMGTWIWDMVTNHVAWSPTLESIHGIPVGSFDGSFEAYQRDIHPDDRAYVFAKIEETLGGEGHHLEYRIVRPDGEVRWLDAHGRLVRDAEGRALRLMGVCMDVTERKLAELERARMSEELARVAEFRQRLLGIVAHDLRNPLAAISMSAQLLRTSERMSDRELRNIERIERGTQRMSQMIADLLDYTHGQTGEGIPLIRSDVDMAEIARRVIDEIEATQAGCSITLLVEGRTTGQWDGGRVAQVVANLITNAIQHGGGAVRLAITDQADRLRLRVSNDGPPIPGELLPRLLLPFARGAAQGPGLGLGLYIVNEIVRAHGGSVEIESTAADGTHVTTFWPR